LCIEESLRALSFPIIEVLESYSVPWSWKPPNNIYVLGRKISGSAQARSGGRLLHHGTLLVETDLDRMSLLLKKRGRSRWAPVINLTEIVKGTTVEEVISVMRSALGSFSHGSTVNHTRIDSCPAVRAMTVVEECPHLPKAVN
jgi:lipoate-protein ligase A